MLLRELKPRFLKLSSDHSFRTVDDIAAADGIMFLCPKCRADRGDAVGVHSIICWQPHVSQNIDPTPGRWKLVGTGLDDLWLRAKSSSVLLTSGCRAHFFVESGKIRMC